ncbi:ATPase [Bacillus sp. FJAT-27225]|uniref:AAA family ATPase n=1 Tax=Bacillus sp. FJAT-27225 TaxID=1743144 RepID=UPI00080C2617|nr:AAA family ATPase [Bacillus sp. FJAT-27225]OCA84468.1 ATPase [Bacillus sp. FJAT-27225]
MLVKFLSLNLQNYKSHRNLEVKFGDLTKISGDNAKGKSSILESISWLFYGNDVLGSKVDPSPITYAADETMVSLLLQIDGKNLLLGRGLKKGKAQYYINEVPSKAKEFDELLSSLFEKELFMSLFNPSYFPSLHWEKQRGLLLQYVSTPIAKEVLKHLPEAQAQALGAGLKKHSLEDMEKVHKENKNKKDKAYIAAQSRTKTLKESLEANVPSVALDTLKVELSGLLKEREAIEKVTDSAGDNNNKYNQLQNRIKALLNERIRMQEEWPTLKNEQIQGECRVCKQPLKDDALSAAEADKQARMQKFKKQFDQVVIERKELEEEFAKIEYIDVSEQMEKLRALQERITPLELELTRHKNYEGVAKMVEQAEADEKETLKSLNDSIFILDSIKAFRAKEAKLQAEKVQALFTTLSVRLFDKQKNGEIKPTFEIEMDDKPYRKLSLSESIRAGLELRDVLSQQSELITPCFVDNAESITRFKEPNGQLIISRVVAGQELKVGTE